MLIKKLLRLQNVNELIEYDLMYKLFRYEVVKKLLFLHEYDKHKKFKVMKYDKSDIGPFCKNSLNSTVTTTLLF